MDKTNLARALIGQGLGMGWGDEGEAWLRSKLGDDDYEETLKRIRGEYGKFADESPFVAGAAEFAGGALPGVAMMMIPGGQVAGAAQLGRSALSSGARMAAAGGVSGAVAGAGSAEEGNRGSGALTGGVIGTGLGVALPAAMRGGSAASRWLAERAAPTESRVRDIAVSKMADALREGSTTAPAVSATMAADRAIGVPSVVANANPALAELAEAVAQRTGRGGRKIETELVAQKLGSKERAYQQTHKALNPGNYYDDLEQLQKDMRDRAGPLYEAAYARGEVTDPNVLRFMTLPQFQQGLGEAQKLLAAEGRQLDMTKPTVEVLDQVKRGLDTLIEKETDSLTGKTSSLGRVYTKSKNDFLKAMDVAVPEYELARGVYAGGAELQSAMRAGLNDFKKLDHEQVAKSIAKMSDAEKDAYRTGVVRDLYGKIMDPAGNFNAAQRVIGSPEAQLKLQPLFKNPAEFSLFKTAMEREAQLFNQSNRILGGSQTGKRMQMRDNLESGNGVGEAIGGAITGGLRGGLVNMVMGVLRKGQMTEKTSAKLADMLMSKDPHEVAAVVQLLQAHAANAGPKAVKASAAQTGAATGSAVLAAPAPQTYVQPSSLEDDEELQKLMTGPGLDD